MSWITDKLAAVFAPKYIKATVRTLVAALSGFLVSSGIDSDAVQQLTGPLEAVLTGAGVLLVTWVFSIADKKKNQE